MTILEIVNFVINQIKNLYPNIELINYTSNLPNIKINLKNTKNINIQKLENIEEKINKELNCGSSCCVCKNSNNEKLIIKNIDKNKENSISLEILYFQNNSEYQKYIKSIEQAENNDHRGIGKKLEIFNFDPLIGSGMPIFLEYGTILKKLITDFINKLQKAAGIKLICTPELGSKKLYTTSGHFEHYQENIFPTMKLDENTEYILRPMTCPHHILVFKMKEYHIKQLPIALGENAKLFRYEYSGGLFGLERVRSMELIDTHIFCSITQIQQTIKWTYNIIQNAMKAFNIELDSVILALKDNKNSEKFFEDKNIWESAENQLTNALEKLNIKYETGIGDAAFYGPKIDFQIKTYTQKIITLSTIQLDFLLPKKFNLSFKNEEIQDETPVIIHLGIIGTLERFIAYLLEKNNGLLPIWLSPVQIVIIPFIAEKHSEYSEKLRKIFINENLRAEIDYSKNRLNKKIRNAQIKKIPYQIVIGDNEINDNEYIFYKKYGVEDKEEKISIDNFIKKLKLENKAPEIDQEKIIWR